MTPHLKGKALTSPEGFEEIEADITAVLTEIAAEMRSGNASISPLTKEKPCDYCQMKQFCRVDTSLFKSEEEDDEEEEDN